MLKLTGDFYPHVHLLFATLMSLVKVNICMKDLTALEGRVTEGKQQKEKLLIFRIQLNYFSLRC